ncbi:potassium-transporting ATPase subunit C [Nocardia asteroides NBRC 15531]|uniref:Potassium-transporting ATPase KdpC subunit n=1 Tax=Nocardia asteroides NBRC 15531 TaxID=1110697 RepID=U5E6E9_NOCAS|nr:potassium-transporting ATPase subunit C [Nocardia asteroides]TLF64688.1 potassium-transporting ATPase subunit C [Nocardia asteroides NBRC 15531]UGT50188.1 potassium-transporting ATPase subunit C [Nocardia asteroides]SFN15972.1 K+-transporting ATPase ATPase C chain [Nocardia asteroides]VEG37041.1 potassium-transporting ATPase subunit C [Nocardia asteroides]GAD81903.1 potassium-transporting ATPase C chain [Nocardia asteroides NBRC 15531]
MRLSTWIRQHLAALRALLVLTVITGIVYPVAVFAVAQLPGLSEKADGSLLERDGKLVGSSLIGQSFTDADGKAVARYFQSRPSAAGEGYDPLATGASNLGPEDIVDTADRTSLLSTVCARSKEVGDREGVDGARQFCTKDGVGAVLSVIGPRDADGDVSRPVQVVSVNELCPARPFLATFRDVAVECARDGEDYAVGRIIPVLGDAPADPAVPADAVTASGSGLDPHISPEYAAIQVARVARARGVTDDQVRAVVDAHTDGRTLGFLGAPRVNVVELNLALDEQFPPRG